MQNTELKNGRYTFVEKSIGHYLVYLDGKKFRYLAYNDRQMKVFSMYGYPMTAALLKAFCETVIDEEYRAVVFGNSATYGKRIRNKFPNPFVEA